MAMRSVLGVPQQWLADGVTRGFRAIVSGDPDGTPPWVREMAEGDDMGYFGPGSAVWAVHGNLATLVGGIRALLMQALHPGAAAGVDQHSGYRDDPLAWLAGTTRWLTVTTFGSRACADREAARVRGLHRRVRGTYRTSSGEQTAYRADDHCLLGWVHASFTDSFLTAHKVFADAIPGEDDAYVAQWALAGQLVGVRHPPRSAAELDAVIDAYGPRLESSEVTRRTVEFVRRPPLPGPAQIGYAVLFAGAASTLRPEHRALLGLPEAGVRIPRTATSALLKTLGMFLDEGPPAAAAARQRLARLSA